MFEKLRSILHFKCSKSQKKGHVFDTEVNFYAVVPVVFLTDSLYVFNYLLI